MADAAEEVLDALKEFSTRVWGYDEDKATMAARILWQCRNEVATGAALGSVAGAYAGLGVLSMPGWAVGAFGGIVLGTVHCVSLKGSLPPVCTNCCTPRIKLCTHKILICLLLSIMAT